MTEASRVEGRPIGLVRSWWEAVRPFTGGFRSAWLLLSRSVSLASPSARSGLADGLPGARATGMQEQCDDGSRLIEHGDVTGALDLDPTGLRRQLPAPARQHGRQHAVARAEGH